MKIIEAKEKTPILIKQLLEVWEKLAKTTHLFLSDGETQNIKRYIPQALTNVAHLIIAENKAGLPVAFMGMEGDNLEMLFIAPEEREWGLGKILIQHGIESYAVKKLAVNEQNPQAKGFYEHMGFQVYKKQIMMNKEIPIPCYI